MSEVVRKPAGKPRVRKDPESAYEVDFRAYAPFTEEEPPMTLPGK